MSSVTNLLIIGLRSSLNLKKINRWLNERTYLCFADIGIHSGGDKYMETDILGNALNGFEIHIGFFISFLKGLDWKYKTDLFVQKQHENIFTRIKINY